MFFLFVVVFSVLLLYLLFAYLSVCLFVFCFVAVLLCFRFCCCVYLTVVLFSVLLCCCCVIIFFPLSFPVCGCVLGFAVVFLYVRFVFGFAVVLSLCFGFCCSVILFVVVLHLEVLSGFANTTNHLSLVDMKHINWIFRSISIILEDSIYFPNPA